ncbi:MAG: indolepyruvate ferredoxin oxidoreductase family protein [Roseovarius sp.]|nr:indolepyruvate ferredoxin oxidoreductase family protein [Roseovarius sp.]
MKAKRFSLDDRFDITKSSVLLNGTQALVRLMLMQSARDKMAGRNTAGYVTGYRGSPLGAVDMQMGRAEKVLANSNIMFQPGLNEDLAATALWGTQQAELRGEGRFDGVFGMWYGKGPGVDRSGDVMRHANMAGTSPLGGVLMAMGDDHTGESSTVCHQSDWALVDTYMPVLSPAGVQEILDLGIYGFALSRFAGVWCGLKTMKDTVEVTQIVDGRPDRMSFSTPEFEMPAGGLNIRLEDHWISQEARIIDYKRFAAEAFANANKIDRRVWGKPGAKIGFVAAGKNWLDLQQAFGMLGIDHDESLRLGITTYKVCQTFPMDMKGFIEWAEGLDLIVVVEEKRKLIEIQIKEAIFDDRRGRRVYGWYKGGAGGMHSEEMFPTRYALDPVMVARKIGEILVEEGRGTDAVKSGLMVIDEAGKGGNAENIAARLPYFCAGCPHNSSTLVPKGSRAYAGIGCHIMAMWMDRETSGYTHMGGEGANWTGEAPFSTREHVFQNMGDGTYNHSGILSIRAALAAGTNVTYKILFNDAVAMTGGQGNEGELTPQRIARELLAMGVRNVAVVHDPKEEIDRSDFPRAIDWHERSQINLVQEKYKNIKGVSAIIYVQTCAAEKRRRRKRGKFPDPDRRIFINSEVCEGCGDCGIQSNCVAIVPLETELGRKRAVDQSSCNKDFSCLKGFCPSFVSLEGAKTRREASRKIDLPKIPKPVLPAISGTYNMVVTGVGGTGVVTIGAVIAQAAQVDGKGVGMMEMAGLAQKGGAVHIHCRLSEEIGDINAIRVAMGEAHALIGGDLVVSAQPDTLALASRSCTGAVVNSHEIITGHFTRDTEFRIPAERLELALRAKLRDRVEMLDATSLARDAIGDTIYSNMIVFGAAWQNGLVPLSYDSIAEAIRLNGAAVQKNLQAFEVGRWAVACPEAAMAFLASALDEAGSSLEGKIEFRFRHLVEYQDMRLARRYVALLEGIDNSVVKEAAALGYHKLLAYKDEYEVARLLLKTRQMAKSEFDGDFKLNFHLAPPMFSGIGADGRPKKREFGSWMEWPMRLLAKMKFMRGTPFDVFGWSEERKMERDLIRQYEQDIKKVLPLLSEKTTEPIAALARLPLKIRGFGPVKMENAKKAARSRKELLDNIEHGDGFNVEAAE